MDTHGPGLPRDVRLAQTKTSGVFHRHHTVTLRWRKRGDAVEFFRKYDDDLLQLILIHLNLIILIIISQNTRL